MIRRLIEIVDKLIHQYDSRTIAAACFSFLLSVGFAAFNAVISALTFSFWYGALAAYYCLLAITRFGVIFHHLRTNKRGNESEERLKRRETRTYNACGIIIILLAVALAAAVVQLALSNRTLIDAPGLTIYLFAVYTFYKVISSVFHLVRAHKDDDITIQAVRNVNFADALVSVLALQTAMLHVLAPEADIWQMNALTGTLVCLATFTIGILMVVVGARKGKRLKAGSAEADEAQTAE